MPAPAPDKPNAAAPGGYQVARPQGRCVVSGRAIEPDERFMAALRPTPGGFERLDVSMAAWDGFDRAGLLGFWQTVMPRPEQKKQLFVDDEILGALFERLADAAEPDKVNFRFVLGLILMRKRILAYESTRQEPDGEIWVVRFRGREQRLDLRNPRLDDEQMVRLGQQLSDILNEEL